MLLSMNSSNILIKKGDKDVVAIPAAAVTDLSYGQDVHRRVGAAIGVAVVSLGVGALLALTKSKNITWDSPGITTGKREE
jgi:hypothetical protein